MLSKRISAELHKEILACLAAGEKQLSIAVKLGVGQTTVSKIKRGVR